jgi:hypothetical protein
VLFTPTGVLPEVPIHGWRVFVWGADECGMENDFKDNDEAWECFCDVIKLEYVTMKALKERGFISA